MIPLPLKPEIIEEKDNKASFKIEALYPGYGATLGNSLRRVLFSSLEGAAVTQVKIKGVQHEFSTIDGVLEDVITILLNIKKLRFKTHSDEPQVCVLSAKGEKEVKGTDIKLPTQLELINKNTHIASLTDKKSDLEIEIWVEKGLGYITVEQRKKDKLEVGQIALDAIFTPIQSVNFRVENMRVGERTDFDRLFIDIETDGTVAPSQAFRQASEILVDHFLMLKDVFALEEKIVKTEEDDWKKTKVEELKLSARTINVLLNNNVKTAAQILKKGEEKLLELDGMGEKGLTEIKKLLKKLELKNK